MAFVFVTGATGFMGRNLAAELLRRGHRVRGLARRGSESRLPAGCEPAIGDPLDAPSYRDRVAPADTFVQLVGVSHPSPAKAAEFRSVDLVSAKAGVEAAVSAGVRHFVYVSVAHPAPVMREYIAARTEAEEAIGASGLNATILRPWYVLGPGRRWPLLLLPAYWVMEALPGTRDSARQLGLVTLPQMVQTLALAVERPATGVRIVEVPQIRSIRLE
ncbi:MAG TPA: NAD(P)H-binding protein [Bryobacteraceae bacterium]|nr:NAD(P)H-binding protein [Bryobacteraceae bacterium]